MWKGHLKEIGTFALGAFGFLHEVLFSGADRPYIIAASLALMGLPFVLSGDRNGK